MTTTHVRLVAALPLFVVAALTCATTAQTVTVGPPGSGAMFATIAEGIAAAPAGGVVRVAPGHYTGAGLRVDKPLTLLGESSATTVFTPAFTFPGPSAPLLVVGLGAGERVVVAGLGLRLPSQLLGTPAAFVLDCAGAVVLADVASAVSGPLFTTGGVVVRDSATVTLDGCAFVAAYVPAPAPALHVERATVLVEACTLTGSSSPPALSGLPPTDGAPGIQATDATVRIARSVVLGGAGAQVAPFSTPTIATKGGPAVAAIRGNALVRGGAGNELRGGRGGTGLLAGQPLSGPGGSALELDALSLGALTPDVVATAGLDGDGSSSSPLVGGPGVFAPLALPLATAAASPKLPAPGGAITFALGGEPGAIAAPFLGLDLTTPFAVAGVHGIFVLDFAATVLLPLAVLDPSGAGSVAVVLPPNPALAGIAAHTQSIAFAPSGWISISGPTSFVVR